MSTNEYSSGGDAFAFLRARAEERLDRIQEEVGRAAQQSQLEEAQQYLIQAKALADLVDELSGIADRYKSLVEPDSAGRDDEGERLARGLRTPQGEYRVPILRALVEPGGEADLNLVLERVYESMKDRLNEHDLAPLPSDEAIPRWRNAAQWERNAMREDGLIRSDTPRGIWGISEEGQRWLQRHVGRGVT